MRARLLITVTVTTQQIKLAVSDLNYRLVAIGEMVICYSSSTIEVAIVTTVKVRAIGGFAKAIAAAS